MKKRMLVTRPEYDLTTQYLSSYAGLNIKFAKDNGILVTDMTYGNISKNNFNNIVKNTNPKLLFLNGHGEENYVIGDKNEIILKEGDNHNILKGKITYARTCWCGVSLGKKCEEYKTDSCFIGYNLPFRFLIDENWSSNPLKDKLASLYLIPSNELVKFIIKGNKTGEAHEKSKRLMIENMNKIISQNEPWALGMLKVLWTNYDGQVIYGNKELVFE
jgi:hypothetical protein